MSEPSVPHAAAHIRWRLFLRALAVELDGVLGTGERDALLARVGAQMAHGAALPPVADLEALAAEINAVLVDLGWGHADFDLEETTRTMRITHTHLPTLGSVGGSGGGWLSAVLEGLYTGWLAQQPDAVSGLAAQRTAPSADGAVVLVYGRLPDKNNSAHRLEHDESAAGCSSRHVKSR